MEKTLIAKLTPEQEAKIPQYLQRYYDMVYNPKPIDKESCEDAIYYIYDKFGYKKPLVWYVDSIWMAQIVANLLTKTDTSNLRSNLMSNLRSNLGSNLMSNLGSNLRSNLDNISYQPFSYYGNVSDYGWTCFYEYINDELLPSFQDELWNKWKQLMFSGIYDGIQFDGLYIVVSMPHKINKDNLFRLHCDNGPSVLWNDGFCEYAWHGAIIPKEWIENKDSISKETIIKETNAEKRRCLQEILGGERYLELLGVVSMDKDTDQYGNDMILYKTKQIDNIISEHIYYLSVICPSTKRKYMLCVPECKNVWEAKSWTFKNEKIQYRHGDVGLKNIKVEFEQPICES